MTSLITNISAMVALQTLRGINSGLDGANTRVSTGLRINSAQDGAAYWSIATTTRSDNGALSAAKDALALGKSSVDVAKTGMDEALDALKQVKNLLVTASSPDADRAKIQQEIKIQLDRIAGAGSSASTSGNNWLSVDSDAAGFNVVKSVVGSFSRSATGVSIDTIDIDTSGVKLYNSSWFVHNHADGALSGMGSPLYWLEAVLRSTFASDNTSARSGSIVFNDGAAGPLTVAEVEDLFDYFKTELSATSRFDELGIMDKVRAAYTMQKDGTGGVVTVSTIADMDISKLTGSADDLMKISNYASIVDEAIGDMTDANTTLGANAARIASQSNFAQALIDANDRAIGALVDADMEAESTKLKALQTQQQLAIQSLSIANSSTQNVLSLFRG